MSIDNLMGIVMASISYAISIVALYGMVNKRNWFYYPEKSRLPNLFQGNYWLRKIFGVIGIQVYCIIVIVVLMGWPIFMFLGKL